MRKPLRRAGTIVGIWTLIGVFTTYQSYIADRLRGGTTAWQTYAVANMFSVWLWALYTPAIAWLAGRFRVTRRSWKRTLPIHLAAALALTLIESALTITWERVPLAVDVSGRVFLDVASYYVVVVLVLAAAERRVSQRRRVRSARLAQRLTEARLGALRAQLQPHFLFNTLNAAAELVHLDPAAADLMLTRLATLLRRVFDPEHGGRHEIPLREELALLDAYVGIVRVRFADRLTVSVRADERALDVPVPTFVLQPLVENAVRHGIEPMPGPGSITVDVRAGTSSIELIVRDNGRGLPKDAAWREGVGLRNTRRRLRTMYGDAGTLEVIGGGVGVTVIVTIPHVPAPPPAVARPRLVPA